MTRCRTHNRTSVIERAKSETRSPQNERKIQRFIEKRIQDFPVQENLGPGNDFAMLRFSANLSFLQTE